MNVEDFGATPDDFDLDAWIEQGTRPRREVTVYRDWALLEEYERLVRETEDAKHDDEAMGDESTADRIADVLARMEASKLVFVVQALTNEEWRTLAKAAPMVDVEDASGKTHSQVDSVALGDSVVAAAIISHEVTADQVRRMRERLGDGPLLGLQKAVADLRSAGQELPAVPSSRES